MDFNQEMFYGPNKYLSSRRVHSAPQRASLPRSWVDDPRPAMADVRETFVEGMVEMRREPAGPSRS